MISEESELVCVLDRDPASVGSRELTVVEQQRVKAMERLASAPDRPSYLTLQQEIAQQLKMSVRNVRHLMRA